MSANRHSVLAHHFENLEQQQAAATLGMWIFLGTELMIFGGLFTGYTVYRSAYPLAFALGSHELSVEFAGANTLVLLTSSLTMALAVYYAQVERRRALLTCLALTALLGLAFLVIKGFEYHHDYQKGLLPRPIGTTERGSVERVERESTDVMPPQQQQVSPEQSLEHRRQFDMFLTFYYLMTGLHAVHLVIGLGILTYLMNGAWRGSYSAEYFAPVEIGGLYWHFVDVVWIFLLPLLYLIGMPH